MPLTVLGLSKLAFGLSAAGESTIYASLPVETKREPLIVNVRTVLS